MARRRYRRDPLDLWTPRPFGERARTMIAEAKVATESEAIERLVREATTLLDEVGLTLWEAIAVRFACSERLRTLSGFYDFEDEEENESDAL